ncbi:hypothetical protein LTR08_005160 [Meristemomyces frigidus]|nr:hypothetical protein LTR08_005160 [Meristemomyces frigidus]
MSTLTARRPSAVTYQHRETVAIPANVHYAGLILQPDSSPISPDQLAAEIKGIYAGLVTVEAKCINIDAAQAADPKSKLGPEQWQALIAVHRTLLYEHHDFMMATQHPSATPMLRGLPMKYSMPARMWKHGIHAFLEVLRHRRPDSQDYMLSFIYLAYQMMALLYETVPAFLDTWIECLGDLARYRMAIEEEKEPHAQWGGVAATWYTKAADRHPQVGRLYHHLGILERPSLRKFACYSKSLTCVVSFPNARDSMATLCNPIAASKEPMKSTIHSTEASFCFLHALLFLQAGSDTLQKAMTTAITSLQTSESFPWKDCGVPLAITNISALLGHGSALNALRIGYDLTIYRAHSRERPCYPGLIVPTTANASASTVLDAERSDSNQLLLVARTITLSTLETASRPHSDASIPDVLPFMHVMLCFLHSLHLIKREKLQMSTPADLLDKVNWSSLATFLNSVLRLNSLTQHVEQCARNGGWLFGDTGKACALPEDYSTHGLVWTFFAFIPGWFDAEADELARIAETEATPKMRADRAVYYGLRLAFVSYNHPRTGYLH